MPVPFEVAFITLLKVNGCPITLITEREERAASCNLTVKTKGTLTLFKEWSNVKYKLAEGCLKLGGAPNWKLHNINPMGLFCSLSVRNLKYLLTPKMCGKNG